MSEVPGFREQCTDERQRAALDDLAGVLQECVNTAGSYVWFAGD
ncbi:hypothetical protein ACL07V_21175 [Streptomyces sp. MB22_4]